MNKIPTPDCFIGKVDLRSRGLKWEYTFKLDDVQFNIKDNLPIKITIK